MLGRYEDHSVDLLLMVIEPLNNFSHLEVPNYNHSVFTRAGDKPVAFANANINDEICVSMETRLESHRVSVPDLQNTTKIQVRQRKYFLGTR